ncbi:P-loop containing nucleoside triphosphate hydrolase protein [Hygrophoropsis aurantiaca]|uniref:P-loop containing nucleoside triphosphate hydrolase protein n=1 Tax=Hygrophoropsis aurantiaca TaxID=72124 RepID=A0ACB8AMF1_9AGAM|nr:P-loop containing nucleoside triphosphate hydrolase protein [Hygrophoropsis aurantiaca]
MGRFAKLFGRERQPQKETLLPNDIIIPVVGLIGVGKSTFINEATGENSAAVGGDLRPCTTAFQSIVTHSRDGSRRIIFVDTPGFEYNDSGDYENTVRELYTWMSSTGNAKIAGVIYLYDITQDRMQTRPNAGRFHAGRAQMARSVVLVTTKWDAVGQQAGKRREEELAKTFWKDMIKQGSRIFQSSNDRQSTWSIIDLIIANAD